MGQIVMFVDYIIRT